MTGISGSRPDADSHHTSYAGMLCSYSVHDDIGAREHEILRVARAPTHIAISDCLHKNVGSITAPTSVLIIIALVVQAKYTSPVNPSRKLVTKRLEWVRRLVELVEEDF